MLLKNKHKYHTESSTVSGLSRLSRLTSHFFPSMVILGDWGFELMGRSEVWVGGDPHNYILLFQEAVVIYPGRPLT